MTQTAASGLRSPLYCTVEYVQRAFRDSPFRSEPELADLALATEEASALARQAYLVKDPDAIAAAERIIYTIDVRHAMAPPLHGVLSTLWGILMRAKLSAALAPYLCETVGFEEMKERLERAIDKADRQDHPLLDRLVSRRTGQGLVIYAKNWEAHVHGFTRQLIAVAQRSSG